MNGMTVFLSMQGYCREYPWYETGILSVSVGPQLGDESSSTGSRKSPIPFK
jgi:hypothetical protein